MAKLWSKQVGKTFFYSFEQILKQNKHGGKAFLSGFPLVQDDDVEGGKLVCWRLSPNEGCMLTKTELLGL